MKKKLIKKIEGMMANIVQSLYLSENEYERNIYKAQFDVLQELLKEIK